MTTMPISDTAKVMMTALFGDPAARADFDLKAAQMAAQEANAAQSYAAMEKAQAETDELRQALAARQEFGKGFAGLLNPVDVPALNAPAPGAQGPTQVPAYQRAPDEMEFNQRLGNLLDTSAVGKMVDGGNIGDFLQAVEGRQQMAGVTDPAQRRRAAAFGAGNPYSETQSKAEAFDAMPFTQRQLAVGPSSDQVQAADLQTVAQDTRTLGAMLGMFGGITPRNLQFTGEDGQPAQRIGIGPGYINDQGQYVIPSGQSAVFSAQTESDTPAGATGFSGLTKPTQNKVQADIIRNERAMAIGERMRNRIGPQNSGLVPYLLDHPAVGIANQVVPGLVDKGLAHLPGEYNIDQIKIDRGQTMIDIQQLRESLVNEDGKLSDRDQALVTALTGALAPDVPDHVAAQRIDYAWKAWEENANEGRRYLREGIDLRPTNGAPPPAPVTIQSDADYEALPSGSSFIAPDGTQRIKP